MIPVESPRTVTPAGGLFLLAAAEYDNVSRVLRHD
jgi:hypothetical protein